MEMFRSNPKHFDKEGQIGLDEKSRGGFDSVLIDALQNVNDTQIQSVSLAQQLITDPDTVDVHDVSIALAEANMTLSLTKQVVDKAISAYKEITSLR